MSRPRLALLGAILLGASTCADLPYLEPGSCGDRVVEPAEGEDCDTLVDPSLGEDLVCGPPDGSAQECRYVCDGAECPVGWKCEDDGICRAPSGSFEVPDEPLTLVAADEVVLADLVEDERDELVARSGGELTILADEDEGYLRVAELSLEHVRSRLAFADIDDDDFEDLLVVTGTSANAEAATLGVHVLRSDGERLTSTVAPQTAIEAIGGGLADVGNAFGAARLRPHADRASEVVVLLAERDGQLVAYAPEPSCASLPGSASVAVGPVASGVRPTSRDATSAFPAMLAVPIEGRTSVSVVTWTRTCESDACTPSGIDATPCVTSPGAVETIELPAAVVAPGCGFWDANADGERDLVCNVAGDSVVVATSTNGVLGAVSQLAALDGRRDVPPEQSRACRSDHAVLAGGDLDGDGRLDVVTPHGVFVTTDDGMQRRYARVRGDAWTNAAIADFDGDGLPEIVASIATSAQACEATEVERLVPTLGSYNARVVSGSNLPLAVTTGDFDGDALADLALVQRAEDGDVRATVFYGDVKEALEDAVRTGSFGSIDALVAARARVGTTPNEDLVEDLAILSDGGEQWTLVTGSPGRSLLAPLPLPTDPGPAIGASEVSVIAGPLLPRDPDDELPNDLMAFAPGHVWLFRDEDVHHGDAPVHVTDALPDSLVSFRNECALWTHDVDDEGRGATLAAIEGSTPCDLGGQAPRLVVVTLAGTRDQPTLDASPMRSIEPVDLRHPVSLHLFHLGAPGDAPDLVVLGTNADHSRGSVSLLPQAQSSGRSLLPEYDVIAVAPINADRDRELELAAFTDAGLLIVDRPEGSDDLEVSEPRAPLPMPRVPGQVAQLVAGEADGDGLDDLALLLGSSVYVYPSEGVD